MEQQPPLPCIRCLSIYSCGQFTRIPVQCIHSNGSACVFCRDAGKPCTKVPERLTHLALLLCQLLCVANQENPTDTCPILSHNIRIVRRDFFRHLSVDPNIQREDEAQTGLDVEDQDITEPLQEAARVAIEDFEDVQLILRRILPALNNMSANFLEASDILRETSRTLATAVAQNYILARRDARRHEG